MPSHPAHTPRSVLVTGGAGFIGSNYLLRMVPRYPDVHFVNLDAVTYAGQPGNLVPLEDCDNYRFVRGDIADAALVERLFQEEAFSTVLHFAAESHVDRSILDPLAFVRTNVTGTATLLDIARRSWTDQSDVRFHHVSTDEVFGALGPEGEFTEETAYAPRSPYAASKAAADHLARAYFTTYGLPVVVSNASNNYGPLQYPEKLIPLVIRNARDGKQIPVYGKGDNVRDWLHVFDHCDAIDRIMRHGEDGRTYLVGGGEERTNLELVRRILSLVDEMLGRPAGHSESLISFVSDRLGHDFRYALDGSRMENELSWKPERNLDTGLRDTVAWYLDNEAWMEGVTSSDYDTYYQAQYADRAANSTDT